MRRFLGTTSGPPAGPPGEAGPRTLTVRFRLRPAPALATLSASDRDRRQGKREDALRTLHALGLPLGLELRSSSRGDVDAAVVLPRGRGLPAMGILGPLFRPWGWTVEPEAGPLARVVEPTPGDALGVLHASSGVQVDHPWRNGSQEGLPCPWAALLPGLRALRTPIQVRWIARPVGPTGPARIAPVPGVPRRDAETPLPIHPIRALSRELEDLRGERSTGPFWEVGGVVRIDRPGAGDAPWPAVRALLESVSGPPGGAAFSLRVLRSPSAASRAWKAAEELRPPRSWAWPIGLPPASARMAPGELGAWLPPWDVSTTPGFCDEHPSDAWRIPLGLDDGGHAVSLAVPPGEGHHLTIAGETGMGKSTLLQGLAAEFARRGAAVILFDPVQDTARGLLPLLPSSALSNSLWISPLRSPVGINPLEAPTGLDGGLARAERERRVHELATMLLRVRARRFGSTLFWGPRMDDVLTRVLLFLSLSPGSTLRSAEDLLQDPERWGGPLPSNDPERGEAQALFDSLRAENPEDLQGTLRLVREVALSTSISQILCGSSSAWSLDRALAPGAVTLFVLERAAVGVRPSSYLGSALLSMIWSQVMARPRREKVVLLLDEVQEYENDALGEMLRLGRRYNLHVVCATQSLSALGPELRESLHTNSRDLVLFRGSPRDAELVETWTGRGQDVHLPALPRGSALALLGKGSRATLVQLRPLPASLSEPALADRCMEDRIEATRRLAGLFEPPPCPLTSAGAQGAGTTAARAPSPAGPSDRSVTSPPSGHELPPGLRDPLLSLLVASLEAPEGEPFAVDLERVRRLCGEDLKTLRELGSRLERSGALQSKERRDGQRVWWLLREGLSEMVPPPWEPGALSEARARWERSGPPTS